MSTAKILGISGFLMAIIGSWVAFWSAGTDWEEKLGEYISFVIGIFIFSCGMATIIFASYYP